MIAAYFAPTWAMLRRIGRVAQRGRARIITAAKSDNQCDHRGGAAHLLPAAQARRRDFRICADQAAHQALRPRRRRPYRLGQFRHAQPLSQPGDDAAGRRSRLRGDDARFVDGEIANSTRDHARRCTRKRSTLLNRIRWALGYFLVASADYRIARRLNFGLKRGCGQAWTSVLPGPEQVAGRDVDPFEAAVDAVEMGGDEVAHLGLELIDEEGAAGAERRARSASAIFGPTPAGRVEKGRPDST